MKLIKILVYLLVILAALAIGLYLSAGFWVKKAVSNLLPPITGTYASVENVDISLFSGHLGLKNLNISNPAGFETPTLFGIKSVDIYFEPRSLLQKTIVISSVAVEGITIQGEINQKGQINLMVVNDNVQAFLKSYSSATPASAPATKTEAPKESAPSKQVVIQDLTIQDTRLSLLAMNQHLDIKVPTIHKTNIGQNNKTPAEMIAEVLNTLTSEAITRMLSSGRDLLKQHLKIDDKALEALKGNAREHLDNVKTKTTERLEETKEKTTRELEQHGEALKQKIRGLF